MKSPKIILISIPLLTLIAVFALAKPASPPAPQGMQGAQPGSIDELVMRALANGESHVSTGVVGETAEVATFDEAKTYYSVFVARADSKQSLITDPFVISTWWRFTVTETLSTVAPHLCVGSDCAPPAGVAAASGTQLLLPLAGGSVVKDGVLVNYVLQDFPDFTIGQSYLLFVDYDSARRVGAPALGPLGVFAINSDGTVTAIVGTSDLKDDIATRFGNSLSQIRTALGSGGGTNPPPSGCDPTAEQYCYSRLGEWDSSTCSCYLDPCLRKPWLCE
ncbi:MAG TPA: hypothetical protein VFS76_06160 [Pyrinomonadaceae bacterium]|nr:hypothetical protein [Pyrinomonadaceae bacterium]